MNNAIIRKFTVSAAYQPLSAKSREVASVEVSTPPTNTAVVYFQGDDGSDVPWVPGEYHSFKRINLSAIKVKGAPGDLVTIIGGTW